MQCFLCVRAITECSQEKKKEKKEKKKENINCICGCRLMPESHSKVVLFPIRMRISCHGDSCLQIPGWNGNKLIYSTVWNFELWLHIKTCSNSLVVPLQLIEITLQSSERAMKLKAILSLILSCLWFVIEKQRSCEKRWIIAYSTEICF